MKNKIGQGTECRVYRISTITCRKVYATETEAENAYQAALRGYAAGIAPEVYKRRRQSYETEIVDILSDCFNGCSDSSLCSATCAGVCPEAYYTLFSEDIWEVFLEKVKSLFATELTDSFDLHCDNVGIINGRPVMIDFGDASWT